MAAPQFSTFPSRKGKRPKRCFTLQEANRSLPLVSRIVRDIVNARGQASQLQAKIEETSPTEAARLQGQLRDIMSHLQNYVDELQDIGIELKDYDMGLVDFPARHGGQDIYLCWKMGEEKIAYWHELETGFAGRQPVTLLEERE
jgi:hypothetical protein